MIIAQYRFRVADGLTDEVRAAFIARPPLVERVAGFLGMETFADRADPSTFNLFTRWADEASYCAWHGGHAHHASHALIPRGLRLDPSATRVAVLDRVEGASTARGDASLVADNWGLIAAFFAQSTQTLLIACDATGLVRTANAALLAAVGRDRSDVVGHPLGALVTERDRAALAERLEARGGEPGDTLLLAFEDPDGARFGFRCCLAVHPDGFVVVGEAEAAGERGLQQLLFETNNELAALSRALASERRALIAQGEVLRALNQRIEEIAAHDPLTGLFNRRYGMSALHREIERAERTSCALSVLMLDLDHFKEINDLRGHLAGDAVLRAVGGVLQTVFRPYDTVFRFGGEEFVVVLPDQDQARAARIAERVRKQIEVLVLPGEPKPVTASIGVAQRRAGEGLEPLIDRADRAMYAAKEAGRNRVSIAAPERDR